MIALGNLLFLDIIIDSFYIIVVLVIIGMKLVRFFTPTNYSYFILTSYVTLKPFDEIGLYCLISVFLCMFIIREMLLLNKRKIIKNNFIDKVTFSILITGANENKDLEPVVFFSGQKEKPRNTLSVDITNRENQADALLVVLTIGTLIYLGVQYGNL